MIQSKWPKILPELTPEQKAISDDFMRYWHEVLPGNYGIVDKFNHTYCLSGERQFRRTLEVGAGLGEHLKYERLTPDQEQNYYALEIRKNMCEHIRNNFPHINVIHGDCQQRIDFVDGSFDRILAIHVLEHLVNLPAAIREFHRLCDKENGYLYVVIPAEGSMAYSVARKMSAQRVFEKRYKQPYKWFIEREHINRPKEIFEELNNCFRVVKSKYFPIPVPLLFCNLIVGITLRPR